MVLTSKSRSTFYPTDLRKSDIPNRTQVSWGGRIENLGTDEKTVWNVGTLYTYLTSDTTLYISSSNAADTNVSVVVAGLTSDGIEITRTVTTNGRSQVALSGQMYRVFAAQVIGSIEPLGDLYIAESDTLTDGVPDTDSKIKAKIVIGYNISSQTLYTVPVNKILILNRQRITVSSGKTATISIMTKFLGTPFLRAGVFDVFEKVVEFNYEFAGFPFPAMTDIELLAKGSASGVNLSISHDCELINV